MKHKKKVTSYKERWKTQNDWLADYLRRAPEKERLAFAERIIQALPAEVIETMYGHNMEHDGYYSKFQARLGSGVRARRRMIDFEGNDDFVLCWVSEFKLDGRWMGIIDKETPGRLMHGKSAAEAREKAKQFLDEMIAKQEADKRGETDPTEPG
jgi:predicted RNase H-like HicB family nuclease